MSKKSRERREKNKAVGPDDYFSNGTFEMARLGNYTIARNNRTSDQQAGYMEYLSSEYPAQYEAISKKIYEIKEKVSQCNPYDLLMYLRSAAISAQLNTFSEAELPTDADAIVRAQEYIQSIIVSSTNTYDSSATDNLQEKLYAQIVTDFESLYSDFAFFYYCWAAHTEKVTGIARDRLNSIVESQYMYWVRGNRYQVFELEPLKKLLPPHDSVLQGLFGVSAADIIAGLTRLQYSLSQGYANAMMDIWAEYQSFVASVGSGFSVEKAMTFSHDRMISITGKVFGSDLIDVAAVTGWDVRFIDALSLEVGECNTFEDDTEFSGWPIVELPVFKKPFIKIGGKTYAFLYYALFDNIYRIIQKNILSRKPEYLESWKQHQTQTSEEMVKDLFIKLLPGAEAYVGNHYPKKTSLKQTNENDIIVIFQNYLFVIEVKAGSFPNTPPITDFNAHISAYHNLAEVADSQCSRTLDYIASREIAQFYDKDKNPKFSLPNLLSFEDVFTFSVTVDNFNEFAAKAEKSSIITLKRQTVVISYDDLLVYADYFTSPIKFLHYLKQRKASMTVSKFQMYDEFDHLGLYIDRNMYALNPGQYGDVHNVFWHGFREDLDRYFGMQYVAPEKAVKPEQKIPEELSQIIDWLDSNISSESVRLGHYLLNFAEDGREEFAAQIRYVLKRQRETNHTIPIVAFGEIKYCAFVSLHGVPSCSLTDQHDYVYAAASRNEAIPVMWISLEYDKYNNLINVKSHQCYFSDVDAEDADRIRKLGCEKAKDWVELAKRQNGKLGRNDYCPCGSGKKYKFCCLKSN